MPKKGEYVKFKNLIWNLCRFWSILMPENKWKQNPYKNIHQKNIVRSYSYQLVCVDKFSKPFKTYLGKDAVYNFINSMIEESKYCWRDEQTF